MKAEYDASAIELKWQKKWSEAKLFEIDLKKTKDSYYGLVMFPYPSGDKLHVGHWYNFAPADSYYRYQRMHGHQTFTPMGFDAFGLPAENYAIKTGVPPAESTAKNVETMIAQLKRMGCMYDWNKTLNTSSPDYYRWTQWLFLQMYKHGIAYKKLGNVNWCPNDQTVLANEQVWDGKCERCGTEVIQKPLEQWYWQITKYAEELLDGLDDLDWPEKTKTMQRNWIGRSEGAEIRFKIVSDGDGKVWEKHDEEPSITVFTTRPDTLFGVTYLVLSPEHPLVDQITPKEHQGVVQRYREDVKKKTEMERTDLAKEKTGVWTGAYAINPATEEQIPIWIADYALMSYGTGAVMAVPAHDERDWEFAKKFKLPVQEVVTGGNVYEAAFTGNGTMIQSDFLNGLSTHDAKKKITAWLENKEIGRERINYRLRDWLVSRQRYWGAPIPIVYDPEGKPHPVPEEHLPWLLPTDVEFKPTGESPLVLSKEFKERTEKIFGKGWRPEYDTMDTFICSSFYYLRYLRDAPQSDERLAMSDERLGPSKRTSTTRYPLPASQDDHLLIDPSIEKHWLPVSTYIGGPEHACMHLIYARFVMMALHDQSFVSHKEPFKKLVHQGLITHKGAKMSKSKGNVVSPDEFVDKFGADVFRMYLMFMGPFEDGGDWSDAGIKGIDRFVERLWKRSTQGVTDEKEEDRAVITVLHQTIKRVTESIGRFHFNTAISALMEFLNLIESKKSISREIIQIVAKLMGPLAPHFAEEIWEVSGGSGFIVDQAWPKFDPKLTVSETVTIAVQVNGKVRATIEVSSSISEKDAIAKAKEQENVQKYLEGKDPKKEMYIKGRLVSLVV